MFKIPFYMAMTGLSLKLLFCGRAETQTFAVVALFCALIIIGALWEQIDSTPFGFTFWAFVSIIPQMRALQTEKGGISLEAQRQPA